MTGIAFGTEADVYNGAATNYPITIPTVSDGDFVLVAAIDTASTSPALSASSTGTALTQLGTTQISASAAHGVWYFKAVASDTGKVITVTGSATNGKIDIVLVTYSGVDSTTAVDVYDILPETTSSSTHTTGTVTTVTDQDWILQILTMKDSTSTSWTHPGTQRGSRLGSGAGSPSVVICDSNGGVSAGTVAGGGSFVSGNGVSSSNGVMWTIALSPAASSDSGTGSIAVHKLGLSGSGTEKLAGTGSIAVHKLGLSGSGTEKLAGTGSIAAHKMSLSGSGSTGGLSDSGTGSVALHKMGLTGAGATANFPDIPTVADGRILKGVQADSSSTRTFPDLSGLTKFPNDLLIAICYVYQSSTTPIFSGWSTGWTQIATVGSATTMGIGVAYKYSDGTETGTISVNQAATVTGHAAMILLSIPGASLTTAPVHGSAAGGTTSAANPSALSPSWGDEDTLWIALASAGETVHSGTFDGITAPPTNYSGMEATSISGDVVGGVTGAVAFRQNATATEDVGSFTVDVSSARNTALVLAVRPSFLEVVAGAGSIAMHKMGLSGTGSVPLFTVPVGDNCIPANYGGGTQASAFTELSTILGRQVRAFRQYYPGLPPAAIDQDLKDAADAGIFTVISAKPSYTTLSSSDLSRVDSFLASCKAYGLKFAYLQYHEPYSEGLTTAQFHAMALYYQSTIRQYCDYIFGGQAGNFTGGSLSTYESYFVSGCFDGAAVDVYASGWPESGPPSFLLEDYAAFTDGQGLTSFSVLEFGVDETSVDETAGTNFWNYMTTFATDRISAGKNILAMLHFTPNPPAGLSNPKFTSGDYQIPLMQTLMDSLVYSNNTGTGSVAIHKMGLSGTGTETPADTGTGSIAIHKMGLSGSGSTSAFILTGSGSVALKKMGLSATGILNVIIYGSGSISLYKLGLSGSQASTPQPSSMFIFTPL